MNRSRIGLASLAVLVAAMLAMPSPAVADILKPGDLVVSDLDSSSLIHIDGTTGNRSVLTGGGVGTGAALQNPEGLAIDGSGAVLAVDNGLDALVRVDAATGSRSIISGAGAGSGQSFFLPFGVVVGNGGAIYVSDAGDQAGDSFIARVDPTTGARIIISGLGVGSGDAFSNIRGVAIAPDGSLIVADVANQAIFRVDPITGARSILSDDISHGSGVAFGAPSGVTVDAAGRILVADAGDGAILVVDPITGNRVALSGTGPSLTLPYGIALGPSGQLFVSDSGDTSIPTLPTVFQVDPLSGNRTAFSNFANGSGVNFQNLDLGIVAVRAVPEPTSLALIGIALATLTGRRLIAGRSRPGPAR